MTPEERRAFGAHVARLRSQRGLTQVELASRISRTSSWVSQVERGIQPVVRLDVLRLLADGLGVPVSALQPDVPPAPPEASPTAVVTNDLDAVRLLVSGHPALGVVLNRAPSACAPDLTRLAGRVRAAWVLAHAGSLAELGTALAETIPQLERAVRTAPPQDRSEVFALLAEAYQVLSAAFTRQGESDAAWVAAERAISTAEQSGQPYAVCAGLFRLAQAFVRGMRLDQAEHTAGSAVEVLGEHIAEQTPPPEALSVLGSLHLVLALVHARAGRRGAARTQIAQARQAAVRLGADRDDFGLEFGPTNVELWAVAVAVDLGDAGEAIELGNAVNPSRLSSERRSRLLIDMARAHAQRRHTSEALEALLDAEELAPEATRSHAKARETIRELVLMAGREAPATLLQLAERADAVA